MARLLVFTRVAPTTTTTTTEDKHHHLETTMALLRNNSNRSETTANTSGTMPTVNSPRDDTSSLPPCLRLYHEQRRRASEQAQRSNTGRSTSSTSAAGSTGGGTLGGGSSHTSCSLPPAFRTSLERRAAKQQVLKDLTCSKSVPLNRHRIQRKISLKRASWQRVALGGARQRPTLSLLKEAVRRAQVTKVGHASLQERRTKKHQAAVKIQAVYRCYYQCRQRDLRARLSAVMSSSLSTPPPKRVVQRKTSEITMSEFGDSMHHPRLDDSLHSIALLRESRHTHTTEVSDLHMDDSFHSLGDIEYSPNENMVRNNNSMSSCQFKAFELSSSVQFKKVGATRASSRSLTLAAKEEIQITEATGNLSFSSYFEASLNDTPVKRPTRTLSPRANGQPPEHKRHASTSDIPSFHTVSPCRWEEDAPAVDDTTGHSSCLSYLGGVRRDRVLSEDQPVQQPSRKPSERKLDVSTSDISFVQLRSPLKPPKITKSSGSFDVVSPCRWDDALPIDDAIGHSSYSSYFGGIRKNSTLVSEDHPVQQPSRKPSEGKLDVSTSDISFQLGSPLKPPKITKSSGSFVAVSPCRWDDALPIDDTTEHSSYLRSSFCGTRRDRTQSEDQLVEQPSRKLSLDYPSNKVSPPPSSTDSPQMPKRKPFKMSNSITATLLESSPSLPLGTDVPDSPMRMPRRKFLNSPHASPTPAAAVAAAVAAHPLMSPMPPRRRKGSILSPGKVEFDFSAPPAVASPQVPLRKLSIPSSLSCSETSPSPQGQQESPSPANADFGESEISLLTSMSTLDSPMRRRIQKLVPRGAPPSYAKDNDFSEEASSLDVPKNPPRKDSRSLLLLRRPQIVKQPRPPNTRKTPSTSSSNSNKVQPDVRFSAISPSSLKSSNGQSHQQHLQNDSPRSVLDLVASRAEMAQQRRLQLLIQAAQEEGSTTKP
jgi:hypothetical protein